MPTENKPSESLLALAIGAKPKSYPDRLCDIDYTAHPHRCGCLSGDDEAQRRFDEYRRDIKQAKAESEVARLTAERDALQQRLNAADQRIDELTAHRLVEPAAYQKPIDYWEGYGYIDRSCHIELRKMVDHLENLLDAIPEGPLYRRPPEQFETFPGYPPVPDDRKLNPAEPQQPTPLQSQPNIRKRTFSPTISNAVQGAGVRITPNRRKIKGFIMPPTTKMRDTPFGLLGSNSCQTANPIQTAQKKYIATPSTRKNARLNVSPTLSVSLSIWATAITDSYR